MNKALQNLGLLNLIAVCALVAGCSIQNSPQHASLLADESAKEIYIPTSEFAINSIGDIEITSSSLIFTDLAKRYDISDVKEIDGTTQKFNAFLGKKAKVYRLHEISTSTGLKPDLIDTLGYTDNPKYIIISLRNVPAEIVSSTGVCINSKYDSVAGQYMNGSCSLYYKK